MVPHKLEISVENVSSVEGVSALQPLGFENTSSDRLKDTIVKAGRSPREFYLKYPLDSPPPLIAHSFFVSPNMVEHLMRNKKSGALGVKFVQNTARPDQITNMEGLLHTYVTPIVLAQIHGDYRFRYGHGVVKFVNDQGFQQSRTVVLSAAVQPDFEDRQVMVALASLGNEPCVGKALSEDFVILDKASKQDPARRAEYDAQLRSHIVAHLMPESFLPSRKEATTIYSIEKCCHIMDNFILAPEPTSTSSPVHDVFVRLESGRVLSAELLCGSAIHQVRNEITALELLCSQGYIYTSDPPSIFARQISATLLNRFQIFALKHLLLSERLKNMKIFSFNDYADPAAIPLLEAVFKPHGIRVVSRKDLFDGKGGLYSPPKDVAGALLVIHNNSDGFGQNVQTEHESGSLDGAIGANSSAAASLLRDRKDLTTYRLVT